MKRKKFSRDFKIETVRLSYEREKVTELASELCLRPELIYRWRNELASTGEKSFPGNGKSKDSEDELSRLRRENAALKMERDILKKAVGIFTQDSR